MTLIHSITCTYILNNEERDNNNNKMTKAMVTRAIIRLSGQGRPLQCSRTKAYSQVQCPQPSSPSELYFSLFCTSLAMPVCSSSDMPRYFMSARFYALCVLLTILPPSLSLPPPSLYVTTDNTCTFIPQTLIKMPGFLPGGLSSVMNMLQLVHMHLICFTLTLSY